MNVIALSKHHQKLSSYHTHQCKYLGFYMQVQLHWNRVKHLICVQVYFNQAIILLTSELIKVLKQEGEYLCGHLFSVYYF